MSAGARPLPSWLHLIAKRSDGAHLQFCAKAWQYDQYDGAVFWEARRFALALMQGVESKQTNKTLKKTMKP